MLTEANSANTTDINSAQSRLNGGTNANQKDNLPFSSEPIEGTPFTIVSSEKGYMIRLGYYAIVNWTKTKKEALGKLPKGDMFTLCTIMSAVAEQVFNYNNLINQNNGKESR